MNNTSINNYQGFTNQKSDELRIILLGKTGAGKSATGNTILGREAFRSRRSSSSWTYRCEKAVGEVKGQKVIVIDTPGLFDTRVKQEEVWKKIEMCIPLSAPGPHVFLLVLKLGRFTQEEQDTVKLILNIFGEDVVKYLIVLFTHGDYLKTQSIESFISKSEDLKELIQVCDGRYHVFNNQEKAQVQSHQLLEKIVKMKLNNSDGHYTTIMLEKVKIESQIEEQRHSIEMELLKQQQLRNILMEEENVREFTGGKKKKRKKCVLL